MRGLKHTGRPVRIAAAGFCTLAAAGCGGTEILFTETTGPLATFVSGGVQRVTEDEFNDTFNTPTLLPLTENQTQIATGSIESSGDIDVYDVGPLRAGDRLTVDLSARNWLDAAAAVFDDDINLLYTNDDRNFFAKLDDPYISFVLPRDCTACYVVIATSPSSASTGEYTLAVTLETGSTLPQPKSQTVVLNFHGASGVAFGGRAGIDIAKFDASVISPELEGNTRTLVDKIFDLVRENYVGLNVDIYTSFDPDAPTGNISTIHFGAYDPGLLGVAENVDEFNQSTVQQAIVFTDTFEIFGVLEPTLDQYAVALANVTSHELGHLLGLAHTTDITGLMDITASLRDLMINQTFTRSPLEPSTFPVGFQNAPTALIDSVGGRLDMVLQSIELQRADVTVRAKSTFPATASRPTFSICGCDRCLVTRAKAQQLSSR